MSSHFRPVDHTSCCSARSASRSLHAERSLGKIRITRSRRRTSALSRLEHVCALEPSPVLVGQHEHLDRVLQPCVERLQRPFGLALQLLAAVLRDSFAPHARLLNSTAPVAAIYLMAYPTLRYRTPE